LSSNDFSLLSERPDANRWVGLGVIADSIVNIGRAMEKRAAP
jgi:hypothetical protein